MASRQPPGRQVNGSCPICKAPIALEYRPFCSRRCADVDLSRWLRGAYAVPAASADDDEDGESHEATPEGNQSGRPTHENE